MNWSYTYWAETIDDPFYGGPATCLFASPDEPAWLIPYPLYDDFVPVEVGIVISVPSADELAPGWDDDGFERGIIPEGVIIGVRAPACSWRVRARYFRPGSRQTWAVHEKSKLKQRLRYYCRKYYDDLTFSMLDRKVLDMLDGEENPAIIRCPTEA